MTANAEAADITETDPTIGEEVVTRVEGRCADASLQ